VSVGGSPCDKRRRARADAFRGVRWSFRSRDGRTVEKKLPDLPMTAGLLDEHVGHCAANAAAAGDQNKARDMVTEATQAIARIKT
jgi:hypothetical protein